MEHVTKSRSLGAGEPSSGIHDRFIADVAVNLERHRAAIQSVEGTLARLREHQDILADKVSFVIQGQCVDLEQRISELRRSLDKVAREQERQKSECEQIGILQKSVEGLGKTLADPVRNLAFVTHEALSPLAERVETLERGRRSSTRTATVMAWAIFVAAAGGVIWALLR